MVVFMLSIQTFKVQDEFFCINRQFHLLLLIGISKALYNAKSLLHTSYPPSAQTQRMNLTRFELGSMSARLIPIVVNGLP
jgi:hypothetical protein